jgi:hypothetical protein
MLVGVVVSVGLVGGPAARSDEGTTADAAESGRLDLETYAKDFSVSVEEAERRFAVIELARTLQAQLRDAEPNVFGGLWISHEPFEVVVNTLAGEQSTIEPYILKLGLTDAVRLETTGFTEDALYRHQTALPDKVPAGHEYGSGIDIRTGHVEVRVGSSDVALFEEADLGPSVVVAVNDRIGIDGDIIGGLALSNSCTSGFTVHELDGTRGITTAGHCTNTVVYQGTNLPMIDEQFTGNTDAQWHFTPNIADPNQIRVSSDGTRRDITSVRNFADMMVGDQICKYGRVTLYDCGVIDALNESGGECQGGVYVKNTGGDLMDGGDSGGPVFKNNRAWGLMECHYTGIFGEDNGDMSFVPQNRLANIGVYVNIT